VSNDGTESGLDGIQRQYDRLASFYDFPLVERLVYARARTQVVELLRLQPGDIHPLVPRTQLMRAA